MINTLLSLILPLLIASFAFGQNTPPVVTNMSAGQTIWYVDDDGDPDNGDEVVADGGSSASGQPGTVLSHQKISDTQGGFMGMLDNGDEFGLSLASLGDLDGDGVGDLPTIDDHRTTEYDL